MESLDDATEALRRKIDQMLLNSNLDATVNQNVTDFHPKSTTNNENSNEESKNQPENRDSQIMEGVDRLDQLDIAEFLKRSRKPQDIETSVDEREEIQNEVQTIIRNCLMVEDEATLIKNKGKPVRSEDLLLHHADFRSTTMPSKGKKSKSKQTNTLFEDLHAATKHDNPAKNKNEKDLASKQGQHKKGGVVTSAEYNATLNK